MIRPRHLVLATLVGAAIPVIAFLLLWLFRPHVVWAEEEAAVLLTAISSHLDDTTSAKRRSDQKGTVYIKSALDEELVEALRQKYPASQFEPWSQRPPDRGCQPTLPDTIVVGPCERDDFISASVLTFPLWRTALVGVGTFNSGADLVLVKFASRWVIISNSWWVT